MEEMLGTGTYGKLRGDPTATQENRLSRKLKGLEKSGEITSGLYNRLRVVRHGNGITMQECSFRLFKTINYNHIMLFICYEYVYDL